MIEDLDCACWWISGVTHPSPELSRNQAARRKVVLRRYAAIATHARALAVAIEALRAESAPHFLDPSFNEIHGRVENWDYAKFSDALGQLPLAAVHAAKTITRGKGRPALQWRHVLIAFVYLKYPPGRASKAADSHFERTVELVLGFLKRDIENVHAAVIEALDRQPQPPAQWCKLTEATRDAEWQRGPQGRPHPILSFGHLGPEPGGENRRRKR